MSTLSDPSFTVPGTLTNCNACPVTNVTMTVSKGTVRIRQLRADLGKISCCGQDDCAVRSSPRTGSPLNYSFCAKYDRSLSSLKQHTQPPSRLPRSRRTVSVEAPTQTLVPSWPIGEGWKQEMEALAKEGGATNSLGVRTMEERPTRQTNCSARPRVLTCSDGFIGVPTVFIHPGDAAAAEHKRAEGDRGWVTCSRFGPMGYGWSRV